MEAVSSFKSFSLRLKTSLPLKEDGVTVESVHCQSQSKSQSQVMEPNDVLSVCPKSIEKETEGRESRRVMVLGLLPLPLFLETEKAIYVLRTRN